MDLFGLSEFLCALVGSPELIGCLWSSQHCQDGQRARVRDNPPPFVCLGEEVLGVPEDIGKVRIAF